jgi:hypothetical protein
MKLEGGNETSGGTSGLVFNERQSVREEGKRVASDCIEELREVLITKVV